MTPEVALLVRAALLGLVVLVFDHLNERRQLRRSERLRTLVRLPAVINPGAEVAQSRAAQVSPAQLAERRTALELQPAGPGVVRLEPQSTPRDTPQGATVHVVHRRAA